MLAAILAASSAPALAEKKADNDKVSSSVDATRATGNSVRQIAAQLRDFEASHKASAKITADQARRFSETLKVNSALLHADPGYLNLLIDTIKIDDAITGPDQRRNVFNAVLTKVSDSGMPVAAGFAADKLPPALLLTKADAEAAGWPCDRERTMAVEESMLEAAKSQPRRAMEQVQTLKSRRHAHVGNQHRQTASKDCDDCPDCADGTCTEASHQARKDFDCVDCPDHADV